jgi:hypothetical protein
MKQQSSTVRAQKTVAAIAIGTFLSNIVQAVVIVRMIIMSEADWRWIIWYIAMLLLPVIVFGVFWKVAKGASKWQRLSEASLLSIATVFTSGVLNTLLYAVLWVPIFTYFNASASLLITSAIGVVFELIILAVLVWLMKRHANSKQASSFGRKVLIASGLAFFTANVFQTVLQVVMQYPYNQNLSAYESAFVGFGAMAILFILVVILEMRRKAKGAFGTAIFVTSMATVAAYSLVYIGDVAGWSAIPQGVMVVVACAAILIGMYGSWWLYKTLREL